MCGNLYPSSFHSPRAKTIGAYSAEAVDMTEAMDLYRSEGHRYENA